MNHLLFEWRGAHRGRRLGGLGLGRETQHLVRKTLHLETHTDHGGAREFDGFGVGRIEEKHGRCVARTEAFVPHLAKQVAHVHGDIAKVDFHRAWRLAFVAHRAVVGHVFKLFPMANADAAAGLLFIQKSLDQQRSGQDFVARAVQQIGARHVGGANRFALAAAQAVFDRIGNRANVALLHDDGLVAHQAE